MAVTTWLIDKSTYTRLPGSPDAQAWVDRIERGMVRMRTVTRLPCKRAASRFHRLLLLCRWNI